jgi:DNA damage-binding protein 1
LYFNEKSIIKNGTQPLFIMNDFNSLAIGNECGLAVGTIDDYSRNQIRSIPLDGKYARQICHQEQTRTFAICSLNCNPTSAEESEEHSICLLDEDTFECISVYPLHNHECACSIISCSFSDDKNVYFCVGTGYVFPGEDVSTKVK